VKHNEEFKKVAFPPLDDEDEIDQEDEDTFEEGAKEEEKKPVVLESKFLKKPRHEKPSHAVHFEPEEEKEKPAVHRKAVENMRQ